MSWREPVNSQSLDLFAFFSQKPGPFLSICLGTKNRQQLMTKQRREVREKKLFSQIFQNWTICRRFYASFSKSQCCIIFCYHFFCEIQCFSSKLSCLSVCMARWKKFRLGGDTHDCQRLRWEATVKWQLSTDKLFVCLLCFCAFSSLAPGTWVSLSAGFHQAPQ